MPKDRRPPRKWWNSCVARVKGADPAKVCGRIWTRIAPRKKARIRRHRESFQ